MEHHENMADDAIILKIDGELAERLRVRAAAAGQGVEECALGILRRAVEQPGFAEDTTPWNGALVRAQHDNGFDEDSDAYADELDRICEEALRTGGVPWEQVQARLRNFGQPR
jgi:plasmid stability protein